MLDHHLQRAIVYKLAFVPEARFSDLKPDDIDNKLFTYHLKKVMAAGYVTKTDDGMYSLTGEGRRLGFQAIKTERFMLDKAYSVLFLIVRRPDGAWLLYTRNVHPLIGYTTFPIATPLAELHVEEAAQKELLQKTGITGTFTALGSGYFHVYKGDELESYTNFTLLICEDASGELGHTDPNGAYEWMAEFDPDAYKVLPDMPLLLEKYKAATPFFLEQTLHLGDIS